MRPSRRLYEGILRRTNSSCPSERKVEDLRATSPTGKLTHCFAATAQDIQELSVPSIFTFTRMCSRSTGSRREPGAAGRCRSCEPRRPRSTSSSTSCGESPRVCERSWPAPGPSHWPREETASSAARRSYYVLTAGSRAGRGQARERHASCIHLKHLSVSKRQSTVTPRGE